jgi:hypothetical protein
MRRDMGALLNRLFNTTLVARDRFPKWWPAIDNGNVIDLDAPAPASAPTPKEEYDILDEAFASSTTTMAMARRA